MIGIDGDPERACDIDLEAEHRDAAAADIFRRLKTAREKRPQTPPFEKDRC